jgi:hypothetical protein
MSKKLTDAEHEAAAAKAMATQPHMVVMQTFEVEVFVPKGKEIPAQAFCDLIRNSEHFREGATLQTRFGFSDPNNSPENDIPAEEFVHNFIMVVPGKGLCGVTKDGLIESAKSGELPAAIGHEGVNMDRLIGKLAQKGDGKAA